MIFGVMSRGAVRRYTSPPLGGLPQFYMELGMAAERMGIGFVLFHPGGLSRSSRTVTGVTWARGRWRAYSCRLPDVVFDRAGSESRPAARVRGWLRRELGDRYFNPFFPNKWQVDQWLRKSPAVARLLPETQRFAGEALAAMLARYPVVYAKPVAGRRGEQVIRMEQRGGRFIYSMAGQRGVRQVTAASVEDLAAGVRRWLRGRPALIQQGIDLVRIGSRLCDIRVLAQKESLVDWGVAAMVARIGCPGSPVSNLARGALVRPAGRLLTRIAQRGDPVPEQEQFMSCARAVAAAVEQGAGARFFELGIDLGLDRAGRIWLIEVNPLPARVQYRPRRRPRRAVRRIVWYACRCAGRANCGPLPRGYMPGGRATLEGGRSDDEPSSNG